MKKVLLILSLFCFVLFSQTVAQVANQYIEPSENYVLTKITSGGNDYWIINVNGRDELLIDSTPKLIQNKNEITNILITKFEEESMIEYKREQIHSFISQFQESQDPQRNTCEQYTGVDRMPCYDKESCLKSCYSVPICSMIRSEPFIFTILDWNIVREKVDESFSKVYDDLEKANTISGYSRLRSSINILKSDMEEMEENGLYTVYGFCGEMDLSYSSLNSATTTILEIEDSLSSEPTVRNKANELYTFTNERVNFLNERNRLYTEIHVKVLDLFKENEDNYRNSKVYDEDVEISLAVASTYIDDMLESKNEGNYKIAIQKGNTYYSTLSQLKVDINSLVVRRREIDHEANKVIETFEKSIPILYRTKYQNNLTLIRRDVDRILGMRILSSELTNTKAKMIEYDEQIKDMVSDCVLNGCEILEVENGEEKNETEKIDEIEEVDETEEEVENGEEEKEIEEEKENFISSIINTISRTISSIVNRITSLFG